MLTALTPIGTLKGPFELHFSWSYPPSPNSIKTEKIVILKIRPLAHFIYYFLLWALDRTATLFLSSPSVWISTNFPIAGVSPLLSGTWSAYENGNGYIFYPVDSGSLRCVESNRWLARREKSRKQRKENVERKSEPAFLQVVIIFAGSVDILEPSTHELLVWNNLIQYLNNVDMESL